jgi:hypothetical protein
MSRSRCTMNSASTALEPDPWDVDVPYITDAEWDEYARWAAEYDKAPAPDVSDDEKSLPSASVEDQVVGLAAQAHSFEPDPARWLKPNIPCQHTCQHMRSRL